MPTYAFKCKKCKKITEAFMSIQEYEQTPENAKAKCKCGANLGKDEQQINFAGGINMNNDIKAKAYRKYHNKQGGPVGLSGNKEVGKAKI